MKWSALLKVATGLVLAIAILFFAGVTTTRFLIGKLTAPPPRPTFPNDDPNYVEGATPAAAESTAASPEASPSEPTPTQAAASPTESPSPSPSPTGYEATVVQPIGLVVRQEPTQDSNQVGGIEYNATVNVLETSSDGEWLRITVPDQGLEGWIKAGNTEPVN